MFLNILFTLLSIFGFLDSSVSDFSDYIINQEVLSWEDSLSADKVAVFSEKDNVFLYGKNIDQVQAMASITKLMTAIVFLESEAKLEDLYQIKREDRVEGGMQHFFLGEELTLRDLLFASLIASDNDAAMILTRASSLSLDDFVAKMNKKAKDISLLKTNFVDPVGLNKDNVSTAREVVMLLKEALKHEEIAKALSLSEYRFKTTQGREKVIESTDQYLLNSKDQEVVYFGGKTGYIPEAGFCFVGMFNDSFGNIFYASVLDSDNKNTRFLETRELVRSLK